MLGYTKTRWGRYFVLDEGANYKVKRLEIDKDNYISLQYHSHRSETWKIIKGIGIVIIGEEERVVKPYDLLDIKESQLHQVKALENLTIIEIQIGDLCIEEDIIRLSMNWTGNIKISEIINSELNSGLK